MADLASFRRYWMCLRVGGGAPTHRHESESLARLEAERLARTYGCTVLVLEAIAEVRNVGISWTELEPQPPF